MSTNIPNRFELPRRHFSRYLRQMDRECDPKPSNRYGRHPEHWRAAIRLFQTAEISTCRSKIVFALFFLGESTDIFVDVFT